MPFSSSVIVNLIPKCSDSRVCRPCWLKSEYFMISGLACSSQAPKTALHPLADHSPPPHSLPYSCRSLAPFPVITSVVPYLFSCYLFGGSNPANRHPLTRESLFGRTTPSTTASNEVKQPAHKMLTNIIPAILSCVHVPPETATFVMKRQKACPTKPWLFDLLS